MKHILNNFFILSVLLLFVSCGGNVLDSVIEQNSKSKIIQNDGYENIKSYINSKREEREYKKFFTDNILNDKKLQKYIENKDYKIKIAKKNQLGQIHFYLESSGSIDGYLSGNTSYKNDLVDLIINIKNEFGLNRIDLNYVNKNFTSIPLTENINDITKALTIDSFKTAGDRSNSDLNDIIDNVLKTRKLEDISFIVSDMIYSVKTGDVSQLLSIQESFIKDSFNKAFKKDENLATILLKMNSTYNGVYYSYDNSKTYLSEKSRPYYILIIANESNINILSEKLDILKIRGVSDYHLFSSQRNRIYYSVLRLKDDNGTYKTKVYNNSIKEISDVNITARNNEAFTFTVGVDYSSLFLKDEYLMNPSNYSISKENYNIVSIKKFDDKKLHQSAQNFVSRIDQKITHLITVESKSVNPLDLNFSLKNNIPHWVINTNTNDDRNINNTLNQTFGFENFFKGISNAFQNKSQTGNYAEFSIKITK